jgi:hypothetical protein
MTRIGVSATGTAGAVGAVGAAIVTPDGKTLLISDDNFLFVQPVP